MFEYWSPLVVWLLMIFLFSTDNFSAGETSQFIAPLLTFLFPSLSPQQIDIVHAVIRKLAHVTAYFILALLSYRTLRHEQRDVLDAKVWTGALVLLTGLSDEFHQSLTLTRGASIVDVGYDCLGGLWALWLISTYETRRLRSHSIL
jgi:VanZ family protein